MHHRARRTLLAAPLLLAAAGCQPTLGPGQDWYTFHNDQNSIAKIAIDGKVTGPFYAAGESRRIPLHTAADHEVVVAHGSFTTVLVSWGMESDFGTDFVASVIDPPFVITWSPQQGWTRKE